MTGGRTVRLTIPARPEYITLSRLALMGLARVRPMSEETLADLKLAITEACSNSVRHAYGDGQGAVEILYELHDDRLAIEVADDGEGFGEGALGGQAAARRDAFRRALKAAVLPEAWRVLGGTTTGRENMDTGPAPGRPA